MSAPGQQREETTFMKNTKRVRSASGLAGMLALLCGGMTVGCGPAPVAKDPVTGSTIKNSAGVAVSEVAANKFKDAMAELSKHDANNDWNAGNCDSTSKAFEQAASEQGGKTFYEALYNAGLAQQRCKNDAAARKIFEGILAKDAKFHRARVQVALYEFRAAGGSEAGIEKAIAEMKTAIKDAEFKNVEALVNLASLQMQRDSDQGERGCKNDFACAKLNLQRALAINDGFMPAFNQLAIYYLEAARKKAGQKKKGKRGRVSAASSRRKKVDSQALELAALVCSQALRKNPRYAPVYNTSGLISFELGDLSAAARAFGKARKLDALFFDAHMNYAAVNQQFRGFKRAEDAYRQALKLQPNDFEAHLGLALALRGQINDSNFDKMLKEATSELEAAKKLQPERAEPYYNLAILTQEFRAREGGEAAEPILKQAQKMFTDFVAKAGNEAVYADGVKRAKERIEEIDQMIKFAEETRRLEKEDAERRKAAEKAKKEADAAKKLEESQPKAPDAGAPAGDAAAPAGGDAPAPAGGDAPQPQ